MNERIKELANQSRKVVGYTDGGYTELYGFDHEKFAELIIQECVKIANPKLNDVGEWAAGMRLVQKRIKDHFGVKE